MIQVRQITSAVIREHQELCAEYAAERGNDAIGKPEPQWQMYEAMEAAGSLLVFGVYKNMELAGFASVLISVLPHYGVKEAIVESLFVSPKYRGLGCFSHLRTVIKAHAKLIAGCRNVLYSAPYGSELEARLGRDCERTNTIFRESLG